MVKNPDDQARDCRRRAADCVEQAKRDQIAHDEWMSLRSRYLALARGIEKQQLNQN